MEQSQLSAMFSGMPLWVKKDETSMPLDFKKMMGTFHQMENGLVVGNTYFAIYNSQDLTKVMNKPFPIKIRFMKSADNIFQRV